VSRLTITNLSIPYPDFKYAETINPDQFDANNQAFQDKVNELIAYFEAKDKSTPWTPLTLLNNWVPYDVTSPPMYKKDSAGNVHVKGLIKGGTAVPMTTLFQLPVGFRPTGKVSCYFVGHDGSMTATRIEVQSNGYVYTSNGGSINNSFLILDGINFVAEA
jgi:hypothetical protein